LTTPASCRLQAAYRDYGLELIVIEDTAPMDAVRLGTSGRDEQISWLHDQIRAMGELGIGTLCYNWHAVTGWDDPPLPEVRGVPRIMGTPDASDRVLRTVPSDYSGITLCQGNFTLMTDDLPALIRRFGSQRKIFFVHFRDVAGDARRFIEVFHDEGPTDMLECMRAYYETSFDGPMRPDHVPALEGESNESFGYATLGRLFAVGYITGLREAAYGRPPGRYGRPPGRYGRQVGAGALT
jgi:D-mannonate dehydratase